MIRSSLIEELEDQIKSNFVLSTPISGGDINEAYRLEFSSQTFFLKQNEHLAYRSFLVEAKGLELIRQESSFRVPGVVAVGECEGVGYLMLEWIEPFERKPKSAELLGTQLARMHIARSSSAFGLDYDNMIGSLDQKNSAEKSWGKFWIENRIRPQWEMANSKNLFTSQDQKNMEVLQTQIEETDWSEFEPCLLHGDLWSGNAFYDESGIPVLIDPAVYYGVDEVEIAFMKLFGGFPDECFETYYSHRSKRVGEEERRYLWQIYPLLVHLNLFGESYLPRVRENIAQVIGKAYAPTPI